MKIIDMITYLEETGFDFQFRGNAETEIEGFSSFHNYKAHTVTWIKNPHLMKGTEPAQDISLAVTEKQSGLGVQNLIEAENSKSVFFSVLKHFYGQDGRGGICKDAVIESDKIGKNVSIGHHCFIGRNVVIEDGVRIDNGVQIECPCVIGKGSIIHSGVVIGTDGFGYFHKNGSYEKVPHFGGVRIGADVEIGANTCIDRGTIDDTCIGDHVKIDNLCHIAHNVRIGNNSLVIALSMLGGSSVVEEDGYVAPGSSIKNQITIGKNAFVGMGAVVLQDVPQNKVVAGVPAKIIRDNKESL